MQIVTAESRCIVRQPQPSMGLGVSLHIPADSFNFAEDAQQIAAKNLLDVFRAVFTVEQGLRDLGEVCRGVYALRRGAGNPVEIRSQADMVYARNLGNMIDVIDEGFQRRPRNLCSPLPLDAVDICVRDGFASGLLLFDIVMNSVCSLLADGFALLAIVFVDETGVEIDIDD